MQLTFIGFHNNIASTERTKSLPLPLHQDSTTDAKDVQAFHSYGPPDDGEADGA